MKAENKGLTMCVGQDPIKFGQEARLLFPGWLSEVWIALILHHAR